MCVCVCACVRVGEKGLNIHRINLILHTILQNLLGREKEEPGSPVIRGIELVDHLLSF